MQPSPELQDYLHTHARLELFLPGMSSRLEVEETINELVHTFVRVLLMETVDLVVMEHAEERHDRLLYRRPSGIMHSNCHFRPKSRPVPARTLIDMQFIGDDGSITEIQKPSQTIEQELTQAANRGDTEAASILFFLNMTNLIENSVHINDKILRELTKEHALSRLTN